MDHAKNALLMKELEQQTANVYLDSTNQMEFALTLLFVEIMNLKTITMSANVYKGQ